MTKLYVEGGNKLSGEIEIQGSKNSALPILSATLLVKGKTVIHNCPHLSDVNAAIKILNNLGCRCSREGATVIVDASSVKCNSIPVDLMREMRSSVVFLGAVLSRCGKATVSAPGGCELGPRPIDLHLKALKELGYDITEQNGEIACKRAKSSKSRIINLSFPSVGATENIILASCLLDGVTIVKGAAREPEIKDLAAFINACGGRIFGAGDSTLEIVGVGSLHSAEYSVMPDRIVTATYLSAAAVTGGEISISGAQYTDMEEVISVYKNTGCRLFLDKNKIALISPYQLKSVKIVRSKVYPGFPTDAGPTLVAMLTKANGLSKFQENIFESRFNYINQLKKFGAKVDVQNNIALVEGNSNLFGANVSCTDLRGGAALLVASLSAEGISVIDNIHHIDRGYERIENVLESIGAKIKRID